MADRLACYLENKFLCEQALALNSSTSNIFPFLFVEVQVLGQLRSHIVIVMATQNSTSSEQVRSTTTPTGEESVTPVTGPSSLGELSASTLTEPNRKPELIQRAQVGSLMGADRNKESQEKTPKKQSPTLAARPKKFALDMWWKSKLARVCTPPLMETYSVDFAIDTINCTYPRCTGIYLGKIGHMLAFYGKKTNPRAGLLHSQAITASKAITNIPTWMGYFARWRVQCLSIPEPSKILAGCKRLEKENLTRAPEPAFHNAGRLYALGRCQMGLVHQRA